MLALIDHYACGAGLFGKPPKLRQVLRRYGMQPAEALYVGDEMRDAEAARAVGIAFAAVSWGFATPEALRRQTPERLFASVAEIAPAFGAVGQGRQLRRSLTRSSSRCSRSQELITCW